MIRRAAPHKSPDPSLREDEIDAMSHADARCAVCHRVPVELGLCKAHLAVFMSRTYEIVEFACACIREEKAREVEP